MVPGNTHTPLLPLIDIPKGTGASKAKLFKGKYGAKVEFPKRWGGGGGAQTKTPSMRGELWIFPETQHKIN